VPLITLIPCDIGFGVRRQSKFLIGLGRFDDVIAQPFQIVVSILAAKNYRLNQVLRDVECLVISGWIVTLTAALFSTYGVTEKLLVTVVALAVLIAEKKLLLAHHALCKLGWTRDVAELYRSSALRYKEGFLLCRCCGLAAFASLPVLSMFFDPDWQSADVTAYLTLLIYVGKFYIERSFPTDDWGVDQVPMGTGKASR
jgi:hypothetical protein